MVNIHKTELFLIHKDSARALRRYKIFRALSIAMKILFLASLATVMASGLDFVELTTREVSIIGIVVFCAMLVGTSVMYEDTAGIKKVEERIFRLAELLPANPFDLIDKGATEIREIARKKLVERAGDVIFLERELERVEFSRVTRVGMNLILELIIREIEVRRKKVGELYDALLEFNLTEEGGYAWAFEEAQKKYQHN